jgi:hypothetical protein
MIKATFPALFSLVLLLSAACQAADATASTEFAAIEQKMADTLLKSDGPGFARLVSSDWKIVLGDGKTLTIAQVTEALAAGKLKFRSVQTSDLEVRSYGDTVIVIGTNQSNGSWDGEDFDGRDRFTDVFVRKDNEWKCVASHSSPLGDE